MVPPRKPGQWRYPKDPALLNAPDALTAKLEQGTAHPKADNLPSKQTVRDAMRLALHKRVHVLASIIDDPTADNSERIKALDTLARYGVGTEDKIEHEASRPMPAAERRAAIARLLAGRAITIEGDGNAVADPAERMEAAYGAEKALPAAYPDAIIRDAQDAE